MAKDVMIKERYEFLNKNMESSLTREEQDAGWHFCWDWDSMLIHKDWPEYGGCSCEFDEKGWGA